MQESHVYISAAMAQMSPDVTELQINSYLTLLLALQCILPPIC